jgi:hypothetical protein
MPGPVPGTHFFAASQNVVDGRDKSGYDPEGHWLEQPAPRILKNQSSVSFTAN